MNKQHVTVLLDKAIQALQLTPGSCCIDATLGSGGHTQKLLKMGVRVIAFDWDEAAIERAQSKFSQEIESQQLFLIRSNFAQLDVQTQQLQKQHDISMIHGVLFDFGTSTEQLMSSQRGFSFDGDGPLDMRMDNRLGVTAADILAVIPEKQLANMFLELGGEEQSKAIAKKIKQASQSPKTVRELSEMVIQVKKNHRGRLHPATKVFQALRIAVNTELDNIEQVLPQALTVIEPGSRVVTIAFHEGEDRIVKRTFKRWEEEGKGVHLTKNVIQPSEEEIATNPRSRSAKLRIFEKSTK